MTKKAILPISLLALLVSCKQTDKSQDRFTGAPGEVRLLVLDPGHFHAALVQKTSYPQIDTNVYVYAPYGNDVQEYLDKINQYNTRKEAPTSWKETVYYGDDFLKRMLSEKKGNVMIVAGNNRKKTEYIRAALNAGIHVLADKPMAITPEGFDLLKECFKTAHEQGIMLYDIMTERYEITTVLQREYSRIPELFGSLVSGTPDHPAIVKESVHHFSKQVSGRHLRRPAWFFDVGQEGEGIVDVTTHLVDLIQWECFPDQAIDYTREIEILDANRWSTPITSPQFELVTGQETFPDYLRKDVRDGILHVYSNGNILYRIRGIVAKVSVIWNFEAPEGGGDTHYSVMRGEKANLVIRQGAEQNYRPTLYIEPATDNIPDSFKAEVLSATSRLAATYPGISAVAEPNGSWRIAIPDRYNVGHEAHFGQVTEKYLDFLKTGAMPEWEVPGMLAKYYVTTQAFRIAHNKTTTK